MRRHIRKTRHPPSVGPVQQRVQALALEKRPEFGKPGLDPVTKMSAKLEPTAKKRKVAVRLEKKVTLKCTENGLGRLARNLL